MGRLRIGDVRFKPCLGIERTKGLLGWARCTLEGVIVLDNIAVRCDRNGNELISFPSRRDMWQVERAHYWPTHTWVRSELQDAILKCVHAQEAR